MNSATVPASLGSADVTRAVEQLGPAVDTSPIALPAPRMAVDARGLGLGVLAVLASVFALSWAQAFFVPLLFGIVLSYTLSPLVAWLEAIRIPRAAATVVVMVSVIGALVLGTYSLRGQVQAIIDQVPEAAAKLAAGVARLRTSQLGNMQKMQNAATEMEKATTQTSGSPVVPRQPAPPVTVHPPRFNLSSYLWESSLGVLGAIGQALMVLFLVFFLLLGGDKFKRKLVRLTGPSLSKRKITVHILDDINAGIQKFMFMLLTTNLLIALLTWVGFRWIGLENAGAWAVVAGCLHIVPYLGPAVTAVATAVAAFMQFDSFAMASLVAGASLAVATLVGTFVTTWMTGRIARMNSAAVFISLLFWGWLWGIWGLLLSIPIVVIIKVVAQHVEQLRPMNELLGD